GTFINQGIINHKGNGPGVYVGSKATVENFENKGTIESKQKDGIEVNNSTITNFKNSGTIQGGWSGMFINGAIIQTLINEGSIISKSSNDTDAGIGLQGGGTIATIINKGTIRSNAFGIGVVNGKFGKLIMQDGAVVHGTKYSGIIVGIGQTLGDLEISGANTKISGGQNGIFLSGNSKTQKITIKDGARIEGGNNGISLRNGANLSGDINISGGARIEGGNNGIRAQSNTKISGDINISGGARIEGGNNGIRAQSNTKISGDINISGGAKIKGENGIIAYTGAKISGDINISGGARIEGELSGINLWDNTELSGDMIISGQGSMIKGGKDAGIFNENSKITGNITIS
ncbi:MAG: hypothetical protein K2O80_06485, partial [Helicobacter apodemus]|nr:hypothetical protein [Helicobacter apodemus]